MMEPPPLTTAQPLPTAASPQLNYPESLDSSPRSRNTDTWDEPLAPGPLAGRLRLMCSYGGHIVPRPHDKTLCYVCGETRIVVVDRHTSLSDLTARLSKTLLNGRSFTLKYQLPNEDLDSLISVTTDEDLENMIDEYDRTASNSSNPAAKPSRLRLFLFPTKPDVSQSIGPILESSTSSEDWFLNALNGAGFLNRGFSDSASVNCLLGLDDDVGVNNLDSGPREADGSQPGSLGNGKSGKQDIHSVPDSPMIETTSSFGSTSSSPSLANLPPIRVHVEDSVNSGGCGAAAVRIQDQKVGVEEQFSQMIIGQKQQDEAFTALSSPPPLPTTIVASAAGSAIPVSSAAGVGVGDYTNRVISDDERSDHGAPVGYRQPLPPQPQSLAPQLQQKSSGLVDIPSPDSVSSDTSLNNQMSRSKPVMYQEQVVHQIPSSTAWLPGNPADPEVNISDQNARVHIPQQVQESGYVLQSHYDQHQHQQLQQLQQQQQQQQLQQQHQQHQQQQLQQQHQQQQLQQQHQQQQLQQHQQQQLQQHQQQQLQQQQQQQQPQQHPSQPQQFIHAGAHYIHQHPSGAVPIPAFFPVYSPQPHHHPHQMEQQYPVYYLPARQGQAYGNLPVQQSSISESATAIPPGRPQTPPNPTLVTSAAYNHVRNAPIAKTEMAAKAYKQTTTAAQSLVQVPTNQHQQQYVAYNQGYSHIQHPSQSVAPTSATANYAYEFSDPAHSQIYFTQPLAPSQYQAMPAAAVMLPENSAQHPTDNIKPQMRTSQPL